MGWKNQMKNSPDQRHFLDIPPVYFVLAFFSMLVLDRWLPIASFSHPALYYLGVIFILGGIALDVVSLLLFLRAKTGVRPFTSSTAVVKTGPYRFTRNPMYLGMIIILTGWFLLLESISPILVIPIFFWWIHNRFILPEETHMERHLGQAYLDYKKSVRRWL